MALELFDVYRSPTVDEPDFEHKATVPATGQVDAIYKGREKAGYTNADHGLWEARPACNVFTRKWKLSHSSIA
jgi:hypothetical protein